MFKIPLSPETRARMAAEESEVRRLYGLTDTWLAAALLKLARAARTSVPFGPDAMVYESSLLYGLIPELCRRIGTVTLSMVEIDWTHRLMSNYELRRCCGLTLANVSGRYPGESWALLSREVVHGNPVMLAMDRLCPGVVGDVNDRAMASLESIARVRGIVFDGKWTPEQFFRSDEQCQAVA